MGLFGENQDYHIGALEDDPKFDQCMQNLDCDKNLNNVQRPKQIFKIFVGAKTFMYVVKKTSILKICSFNTQL